MVVIVALQVYAASRQSLSLPSRDLTTNISQSLPGWPASELPLAQAEETRKDVAKTLQFDQLVTRLYHRGPAMVNLYAAYWGPDKVATQRHRLAHAEHLLDP